MSGAGADWWRKPVASSPWLLLLLLGWHDIADALQELEHYGWDVDEDDAGPAFVSAVRLIVC